MAEIGSKRPEAGNAASSSISSNSSRREVGRLAAILETFTHSLTHSLEVACTCYLCTPLVDCDPRLDPECNETGKKLKLPDRAGTAVGVLISGGPTDAGSTGRLEGQHENLPEH